MAAAVAVANDYDIHSYISSLDYLLLNATYIGHALRNEFSRRGLLVYHAKHYSKQKGRFRITVIFLEN